MKKLISLIVIVGVIAAGLYYWRLQGAASAAPAAAATETVAVGRGDIFQAVSSTGQVVSNLDVDIKCRASGEIINLPFDISQPAKKGDVLLQLDPKDENRAVEKAKVAVDLSLARLAQARQNLVVAEKSLETNRTKVAANLESAKVRAANARLRADRQRQLVEQNLGSREEYESAQTDAASAENELATATIAVHDIQTQEAALEIKRQDVKLAEADLKSDEIAEADAEQRRDYTTIYAPMDGVLSALNVQKGTIIASATSNVSGGTTIMVLSDLSHIFVNAAVDESDIGRVKLGQDVAITADAYPGKRFHGKVVRIATKGVNTSNVVTFEVKIEVTSDNKAMLKPMMTANVQIVSAQKDDVLTVPVNAIQRKGRELYANVVAPGNHHPTTRPVQVGLTDGENYEIVDGLKEGETVLVQKNDIQSRWNGGAMRMGSMMMGGGSSRSSGSSRRGG